MKTKILSLFVVLIISLCYNAAWGQFYDYRNYYLYIEVGKTVESSSKIEYIHFDSNGNLFTGLFSKEMLINAYKDGTIDELAMNGSHDRKYCSSTSTSKYEVYKEKRTKSQLYSGPWYPGCPIYESVQLGGYWFFAFSLDREEMIYWYTTKHSNEAKEKKYYKRINPEDIIPKEVEYDFL